MNAPIRVPYMSIHVGRSDDIEVARCGLNGHKPDRVYGSCRLPGFTLQHAECFLGQWLHAQAATLPTARRCICQQRGNARG